MPPLPSQKQGCSCTERPTPALSAWLRCVRGVPRSPSPNRSPAALQGGVSNAGGLLGRRKSPAVTQL